MEMTTKERAECLAQAFIMLIGRAAVDWCMSAAGDNPIDPALAEFAAVNLLNLATEHLKSQECVELAAKIAARRAEESNKTCRGRE